MSIFGKSEKVYSPLDGEVVSIENVPDEVFSKRTLGDGVAIKPTSNVVSAPFDGVVSLIFDTGHAVTLTSKNNIEVLIHIGLDTVNLDGKGFKKLVSNEQSVKKGDPLIEFDPEVISKGHNIITPVLITSGEKIKNVSNGTVSNSNSVLFEV